ncbi:peptidase M6 immune inhibitor A [Actinoplanes sp. NPDC049265]|uniref:peptidase M6 immune inhibitor A n=1 Tax=Actinoplanes sp. NPDC049265 TaxID=3363902 RepID=UPI00371F1CA2
MPVGAGIVLSLVAPLLAVPAGPGAVIVADDTREPSRKVYAVPESGRKAPAPRVRAGTQAVGASREWLGLNDVEGRFYRKTYTLRAVGEHIEVWVAEDLAFPAGDCRKDPVAVTDEQVAGLVHEFDTVIYPRETGAFSVPGDRDGTDPLLDGDFTGDGGKTVTLVDNIRDDNYLDFPTAYTYIAGFFSSQLNALVDRNVMTIDAYDWKHRTGAGPPDDATGDLCTSRPAKPHMYEGTFAHEWQHLLQGYTDPAEELWVNEGLSDYAQSLVGYVDATRGVYRRGADTHLTCFQGFGNVKTAYNTTPRECGGPQNSLNLWNEGKPAEVLADYGIAYQFMLYLKDRFGPEVLSHIHRDGKNQGITGVAAALPVPFYDVLHDFQIMTLVDKPVGDGDPRFTSVSLRSTVNLRNPSAYERPGAAPNGADYIQLRKPLNAVTFTGAKTLPPRKMAWTVKDGALFSGDASKTDATAVIAVNVPAADPRLRISTRYGAEKDYDFGYVTVSADGGRTYAAVQGDNTTAGPLGPGVTGDTGGAFVAHSYDLSAYAGKRVLLGFRYVSDGAVNEGGWYVKDILVGTRSIASETKLFRSYTQIRPVAVHHWEVRLIGITGTRFVQVPVTDYAKVRDYDKVVAVVAYDEPTETVTQYAPYTLTVS